MGYFFIACYPLLPQVFLASAVGLVVLLLGILATSFRHGHGLLSSPLCFFLFSQCLSACWLCLVPVHSLLQFSDCDGPHPLGAFKWLHPDAPWADGKAWLINMTCSQIQHAQDVSLLRTFLSQASFMGQGFSRYVNWKYSLVSFSLSLGDECSQRWTNLLQRRSRIKGFLPSQNVLWLGDLRVKKHVVMQDLHDHIPSFWGFLSSPPSCSL